MENEHEVLRKMGNRLAEHWAGALGITATAATTAIATRAIVKHVRSEHEKRDNPYGRQLSVLNSPDGLPKALRQQGEAAMADLNHLSALLLKNGRLTWAEWQAKSGISERRFGALHRVLIANEIVRQMHGVQSSHPPFEPHESLLHAQIHAETYPLLHEAIAALEPGPTQPDAA